MNNTDRHPECHMRTALGNCDPIGGFCTSVNKSICEALHKVSRPHGEWIKDGQFWRCSECGTRIFSESYMDRQIYHAFCSRCGAKMTKGGDDTTGESL